MTVWLLDTGPLVAYLNAADPAHQGVGDALDGFAGQLCTDRGGRHRSDAFRRGKPVRSPIAF